jgi:opacity protein-like surface antigen
MKINRANAGCAAMLGLAAVVCAAMPARAEVKAGQQSVSAAVGAAVPTTRYDLSAVGGQTETIGGTGVGFGGQYLYHLTPAFGVGGEFNYASFGEKNHSITGAAVTSSYKTWSLEAVARYVFMPETRVNPYLIAGFGLGSVSAKATTTLLPGYQWVDTGLTTPSARNNFDGSSMGPAFSIGAGFDADITEAIFGGFDLRWRYAGGRKTYADGASAGLQDSIPGGSGLLVSGKLGWKFGR